MFVHLDRFWKKAGYTPVYLRQTPVSIKSHNLNVFTHLFALWCCHSWCVVLPRTTWQESTPVWCWKSWIQMMPQSRASGSLPSGEVNLSSLHQEIPLILNIVWLHGFVFFQTSVGVSCPSSPTSLAASAQAWHSASCRIRSPRRRAVRLCYYSCHISAVSS